MHSFQKERINNIVLFFAQEHLKKTKLSLSQTALYKYLAFFEFRLIKSKGLMPLELTYLAMEHGPVPIELYANRYTPDYFEKVIFDEVLAKSGKKIIIVKPKGTFEEDYFSNNEVKEMNDLIEIFAQRWVGASVMSDSSHQELISWRITFKENPNGEIDPRLEFGKQIIGKPIDKLTSIEERFMLQRVMRK
jgi:hypothetical protein